jgi:hypothetical protein
MWFIPMLHLLFACEPLSYQVDSLVITVQNDADIPQTHHFQED